MTLSFRRALLSSALALSMVLPFQAMAATAPTPQMALDAALAKLMAQTSMRADSELSLHVQKRTLKERTYSADTSVRMRMSQRTTPAVEGKSDSEGKLVIEQFESADGSAKLNSPITIEWKKVGTSIYFRGMSLPQELVDTLGSLQIDPTPLVGKWLRIDSSGSDSIEESLIRELPLPDAVSLLTNSKAGLPALKQLLRVVRVESTTTSADGHKHLRIRVRLNPQLITMLQQRDIAAVPKGAARAASVREINTNYTKIRSVLAGLQMVVVVDATATSLDRLELGLERIEPTTDCSWNSTWTKQICKTIGYQKTKLAFGVSFFAADATTIVAPVDAQSLEDAFKSITPPEPEPEPVLMEELDASSSMEMSM
ncbi:MAG: hypothetical protein ABIO72_03185 [Patescibacteria group bacterium]